jgi:5-methylcytosine-specific restriction endonuclease McrBC regulatory subunit McrC
MIISVRERGNSPVSPGDWKAISSDPTFWMLVERQIVGVSGASAGKFCLVGNCYVGRALVGGRTLEIREKVPGAFDGLVRLQAPTAPRIERAPSPVTPNASSTAPLISLFIRAARAYLSKAKKMAYIQVPEAGAIIGGRLDVVRTARLRARGIRHRAAFYRTVLTVDLPINQAVYAALREVERLALVSLIPAADLADTRALRLGLQDCLQSVLSARRTDLAQIASTIAGDSQQPPEIVEVAALAGAVLDAAGFGGGDAWDRTVPRAWFVNLENLFEKSLRNVLQQVVGPSLQVTGPMDRPSLFEPQNGRYRANPDIVFRRRGTACAIADAKYKEFDSWPLATDIYEIVAHAAAYGATKAMLFYPSDDGFSARPLGRSRTGCDLWAFGLPINRFHDAVRSALSLAGLVSDLDDEAEA